MEKVRYMISDAAALAGVETHVLRYWEEELDLTIPRNEMGHRYYTRENIQEFQKIKELKEKGYQLKAIRMILHNKNPEDAGVSVPDSAAPGPLPACNREHHHTVVAKPDRQNTDKTDLPLRECFLNADVDVAKTEDEAEYRIFPMYVLTNQKKTFGAICIRYPGMLKELSEKFGGDFYILPSSVHECILVPADETVSRDILKEMVTDINQTQVEPQEILANQAYLYSRTLNQIVF